MHRILYAADGGSGSGQTYRLTVIPYDLNKTSDTDRQGTPFNGLTKLIRENSIRIERALHKKGRPQISSCAVRVRGLVDEDYLGQVASAGLAAGAQVLYTAVLSTSDGNFQDDDPPPPIGHPSRVFTGILELPDAITFKGNVVETDLTIWDPIWILKNNIVKKEYDKEPPQEGSPNFEAEFEKWELRDKKKPVQIFIYDPDRVVFDPAKKDKSLLHLLYDLLPDGYRGLFPLDDTAPVIGNTKPYKAPYHEFDGGTNIAKAMGDVLQSHHHTLVADKSGRIKPVDLYLGDTDEEELTSLERDISAGRITIKNKEIKYDGIWLSWRRVRNAGRYLVANLDVGGAHVGGWLNQTYNVVFKPDLSDVKGAEIKPIHFEGFETEITLQTWHGSGSHWADTDSSSGRSGSSEWRVTYAWTPDWVDFSVRYVIDLSSIDVTISYSDFSQLFTIARAFGIRTHANVLVAYDSPAFHVYAPAGGNPSNPKEVEADRLYAVENEAEGREIFNRVAASYMQLEEFAARTCTFTTLKEPTLGGLYTIELPLNEEVVREHITYKKYKKLSVRMQEIRTKVYTDRSVNEYECTCEIIKPVETVYQIAVYERLLSVRVSQRVREWDKEIEQLAANGWSEGGTLFDVYTYTDSKRSASAMFGGFSYGYVHYLRERLTPSPYPSSYPSSLSVGIRGWGLFRLSQDGEIELIKLNGRYTYDGNRAEYILNGVLANGDRFSLNSRERRINANVHVEYIYLAIQALFERMTGAP